MSSGPTFILQGSWKEEREKGVQILCEEIMTENFPNLGEETQARSRKSREFKTRGTQTDPGGSAVKNLPVPRHLTTTTSKVKDKEKILRAPREKTTSSVKEIYKSSYKTMSRFLSRNFVGQKERTKKESEVAKSCLTLCNPMDCSLPGSSVHGIFQERVLEWVAIPFSRGFS